MIQLESVSKIYQTGQNEVRALDDVSLTIDQGEFVAIRGPSGCGKSTLLALLGGLTQATSGIVKVLGKDLARMSAPESAKYRAEDIGFVFQMFHLLPYLNVLDNVLVASSKKGRAQDKEYAEELLKRFGLQDRINHRPSQISAGERQRVAMARALLNRPKLLLADEPTGNLDPQNASAVLELLANVHQGDGNEEGGTILMVTHEDHAAGYAQTTIALNNGRIENNLSVSEINA